MDIDDRTEWLEADGLGGFASGTTAGIRTRRYHALLLTAVTPPTGRVVLVNGFDAWVDTSAGSFALSTQRYARNVLHPDGASHITDFTDDPWPTWQFDVADSARLSQELFVEQGTGAVVIVWTLVRSEGRVVLRVRPFLSGRDYHSMHHANGSFRFEAARQEATVRFSSYEGEPDVVSLSNGDYRHAPDWYRQFLYASERERALDDTEDLASPGELSWPLSMPGEQAVWVLKAAAAGGEAALTADEVVTLVTDMRIRERRRRDGFPTALDRAADAYLVRRGSGKTIVAGYPWFTDWGRDTFIAVRGLCLVTGRLADARDILVEWAGAVSEGMLPNRFPDHGEAPEFNAVDASLWYVVAVHELMELDRGRTKLLTPEQRRRLVSAVEQIVDGYAAGTRFGIRMDDDGLLAAGVPGVQLTWMDARVGDRVITPRIGKPVEIQALWLNALSIVSQFEPHWLKAVERGRRSFVDRFWNEDLGRLADVIDVDHVRGTRDDTFRPNQILAVGGLPIGLLDDERARRIVDAVEQQLLTPIGLRSLAPGEPGYAPRYEGDSAARDAVYHQGTVWPWLLGPFVDAWVRVRGNTSAARRDARQRFIGPLFSHLRSAGLGHVSEIADAEAPFAPKGCPFQAWSLGELLRLDRVVLAEPTRAKGATRGTATRLICVIASLYSSRRFETPRRSRHDHGRVAFRRCHCRNSRAATDYTSFAEHSRCHQRNRRIGEGLRERPAER
jgi:predicted glycogen debranching enzyme